MKKLALISTFCDSEEKIKILKDNLIKFKELNIDTLIITPYDLLPNDVINLSTHCIITTENPISDVMIRSMLAFRDFDTNFKFRHTLLYPDYGWASLNQIKRLFSYGFELDYEIYYQVMYDLNMNDEVIDIIKGDDVNYFFSNKKLNEDMTEVNFKCGAILGIFNKENLKRYDNLITYEAYDKNSSAEDFIESIQNYLRLPIHSYVVEDLIVNLKSNETYLSPSKNINMFIDNTNIINGRSNKAIIHFYDFGGEKEVYINKKKYLLLNEELIVVDVEDNGIITLVIDDIEEKLNISRYPIREIKIDDINDEEYILDIKKMLDEIK
jgi:hypothetical protein